MKIYFAGSIRGGRDDWKLYAQMIDYLKKYGVVLTEFVGISSISETNLSDAKIYERDMALLQGADVLIAEVSTPSLGVGYEIGKAEEFNKPILCLYRKTTEKRLSAMIAGNTKLKSEYYSTIEEALQLIDEFVSTR
ncbi:nucleoside 2-deoxyribosyltransferase [candidate division KSB1 bacterium]|nr:nucleoside 2-deoxyribosyltransferase [candidate division KSB1 bacterium]